MRSLSLLLSSLLFATLLAACSGGSKEQEKETEKAVATKNKADKEDKSSSSGGIVPTGGLSINLGSSGNDTTRRRTGISFNFNIEIDEDEAADEGPADTLSMAYLLYLHQLASTSAKDEPIPFSTKKHFKLDGRAMDHALQTEAYDLEFVARDVLQVRENEIWLTHGFTDEVGQGSNQEQVSVTFLSVFDSTGTLLDQMLWQKESLKAVRQGEVNGSRNCQLVNDTLYCEVERLESGYHGPQGDSTFVLLNEQSTFDTLVWNPATRRFEGV